jgi:hypothetical protein
MKIFCLRPNRLIRGSVLPTSANVNKKRQERVTRSDRTPSVKIEHDTRGPSRGSRASTSSAPLHFLHLPAYILTKGRVRTGGILPWPVTETTIRNSSATPPHPSPGAEIRKTKRAASITPRRWGLEDDRRSPVPAYQVSNQSPAALVSSGGTKRTRSTDGTSSLMKGKRRIRRNPNSQGDVNVLMSLINKGPGGGAFGAPIWRYFHLQ